LAVPAAVVTLQRRMVPLDSGVSSGHNTTLAMEAERPDVGGLDLLDIPLDALGLKGAVDVVGRESGAHVRVGIDVSNIIAACERLHQAAVASDLDHVNDVERLVR